MGWEGLWTFSVLAGKGDSFSLIEVSLHVTAGMASHGFNAFSSDNLFSNGSFFAIESHSPLLLSELWFGEVVNDIHERELVISDMLSE